MDPMTKAFVADIHGFIAARGLDLVSFAKGQRKDDLTQQYLAKFTDAEGVLFVGRAQEKARVWRTQRHPLEGTLPPSSFSGPVINGLVSALRAQTACELDKVRVVPLPAG